MFLEFPVIALRKSNSVGAMVRLVAFVLLVLSVGVTGCTSFDSKANDLAYSPPEGAIVLRVNVRRVEFTDRHPECGEDCIPWSFWHRYHASVREVLSGSWQDPEVEFVFLQHAQFARAVTRDCYVILVPAGPNLSSELAVAYAADQLLSRKIKQHRMAIKALRSGA